MHFLIKCINLSEAGQLMRTTLTLEDDAFTTAQTYAQARALKLGQAVSELIRLASTQRMPMTKKNGVWVFELPANTPRVTARQVKDLMDDAP
jgi:hypothetical protein